MKTDLKVSDIAKLLNFNCDSVRRLIVKGHIRGRDLNKGTGKRPCYRVSQEDFEKFLAETVVA